MSTFKVPDTYKCSKCKTTGKKLWRNYQTCYFDLTCYNCSGETENINDKGKISRHNVGGETDQICGGRVPAVPVFDCNVESYWGYSSVPEKEVEWWTNLPSK